MPHVSRVSLHRRVRDAPLCPASMVFAQAHTARLLSALAAVHRSHHVELV
jgi:hypothetical protein